MKWKDLSLKERKQIYDSVRANNPDATYFDIKEQFDSIPEYEERTGKSTEELTHSKNPLTRKRAIFAQNAAKWNHKGRKKN